MLRIRTHTIRPAFAAKWRHALVSVLIALTAFAPIARAACDYEHVAGIVHSSGTDTHAARDEAGNPDSSYLESCSGDNCHAISEDVRPATADANVGPGTPTLHALSAAVASLSQHRVRLDPIRRQHPLPPSEPAFKRVPKLLI
jgi:hypothetical protein